MKNDFPIFCIFFLVGFPNEGATDISVKQFISFPTCISDRALGRDVIASFKARSSIECSSTCGRRDDCLAVNVCDASENDVTCELLETRVGYCGGLISRTGCKYREKETHDCLNGGTWQPSGPCLCLPGWAGFYCERIVRDCKEGKLSGQTGSEMSRIQPVGCPYSFLMYCVFEWSLTYILRRENSDWCTGSNLDWNSYKNGVMTCDSFPGLQNLWYILRQGSYYLEFYMQYRDASSVLQTVRVYYWDFKMASEAEDYAIEYSSFSTVNGAEDGLLLGANTPTRFCTHDRDCGKCAQDKGMAWWYTPNCDNYPLTVDNGDLKWPINGVAETLSLAVMQIQAADYYW